MTDATHGRIVVGVDGSTGSEDALRWALDEARLRHASLDVVHAWSFPGVGVTHFGSAVLPVIAPEDLQKAAGEAARESVGRAVGDETSVPVMTVVERGHPTEVLLNASKGADLLVLGSRGHGGFTGMLLGSVSTHVVHHATCPVVIVKPSAVQ